MTAVSSAQVRSLLVDLDFPATKWDVVKYAESRAGAGDDAAVKALRSLPLGDYGNRDEVIRSITVETDPSSASTQAEQAREGPSQVAQSMRRRKD